MEGFQALFFSSCLSIIEHQLSKLVIIQDSSIYLKSAITLSIEATFGAHVINVVTFQTLFLLYPRSNKLRKNIQFIIVGSVLKKFLGPSGGAQNVCAVTKEGTVHNTV